MAETDQNQPQPDDSEVAQTPPEVDMDVQDGADVAVDEPTSSLAGKWQAPLFVLGVILCALAAVFMVSRIPHHDWDERYQAVVRLTDSIADGNYAPADKAAQDLLDRTLEDEEPDDRVAKVYMLKARIRRLALQYTEDRSDQQLRDLLQEYRLAEQHGEDLSADVHERMGEVLIELGDLDQAEGRYEQAWRIEPLRRPRLMRRLITLRRQRGLYGDDEFVNALNAYMGLPSLTDEQYGWAIENKLDVMIAHGELDRAEQLIDRLLMSGVDFRNPLQYQKARILSLRAEQSRDGDEAERLEFQADDILIELTHTLAASDPTGALAIKANLLRGQLIRHDNPREAMRAFETVIEHAPSSPEATVARRGIATVEFRLGFYDDAMEHFEQAQNDLQGRRGGGLIDLMDLHESVADARQTLRERDMPTRAVAFGQLDWRVLEAMDPPAPLQARLDSLGELAEAHLAEAEMFASRREQAREQLAEPEQLEQLQQRRLDALVQAGQVFMQRAALASVAENEIHGESLWAAADAFDNAGRHDLAAEAFEAFVQTRTSDPRRREALFRLGQAYQAMGRYEDAIEAHALNEELGPRHAMAMAGVIPTARCYLAMGPEYYDQAEQYLRRVLRDDERTRPESQVYIEALYVLGKLAYEQGQWDEAVAAFGEAIQRQPGEPVPLGEPDPAGLREKYLRATRSMFLSAECYRESAEQARQAADAETNALRRNELLQSRREKLLQADLTYQNVIARLETLSERTDLDESYRRNSYFARGDCMVQLERYAEAIDRLDQAVFLFSDDPAALGGLVQIYNCHMALGQVEYARAATRRAQVLLEQMRREQAHPAGTLEQWERWFETIERADRLLPERNTL